jgi:hypothetical protein
MSPLSTKILATKVAPAAPLTPLLHNDAPALLSELEVMKLLQQDGCEVRIVCPAIKTPRHFSSNKLMPQNCHH